MRATPGIAAGLTALLRWTAGPLALLVLYVHVMAVRLRNRRRGAARYPAHWPAPRDVMSRRPSQGEDARMARTRGSDNGSIRLGRAAPAFQIRPRLHESLNRLHRRLTGAHPIYVPAARRLRHVLLVGGPGSGKTSRGIIPMLLDELLHGRGHMIAVDAKSPQLHRLLGPLAQEQGVRVIFLDATEPELTSAVEPLARCPDADLRALVESIASRDSPAARDQFWEGRSLDYVANLCTLVRCFPRRMVSLPIEAQVAHLPVEVRRELWQIVRALLARDDLSSRIADAALTLAQCDEVTLRAPELRDDALRSALELVDHAGPQVADAIRARRRGERDDQRLLHDVEVALGERRRAFERHARQASALEEGGSENLLASSDATTRAMLAPLNGDGLARLFSRDDVRLDELAAADERTLVILGMPLGADSAVKRFAGVLADAAIQSTLDRHRRKERGECVGDRPCWFYLDELAQLGLANLPDRLNTVREAGAGVTMAVQNMTQFLRVLGGTGLEEMVSSVGTVLFLGGVTDGDKDRASAMVGDSAVRIRRGARRDGFRTEDEWAVRPRLTGTELKEQRLNGVVRRDVAIQAAVQPFVLEMPAYYEIPEFRQALRLVRRAEMPETLLGRVASTLRCAVLHDATERWEAPRDVGRPIARTEADDEFAATVRTILGTAAGEAPRALSRPTLDLEALGVRPRPITLGERQPDPLRTLPRRTTTKMGA